MNSIGTKKKDVETSKDIDKHPHNIASCQVYDKECETTSTHETNNINQEERIRLNELKEISENTSDNKLDFVEYIKECSKEQQHILSHDNRKNHKLLDVQIKRNLEIETNLHCNRGNCGRR